MEVILALLRWPHALDGSGRICGLNAFSSARIAPGALYSSPIAFRCAVCARHFIRALRSAGSFMPLPGRYGAIKPTIRSQAISWSSIEAAVIISHFLLERASMVSIVLAEVIRMGLWPRPMRETTARQFGGMVVVQS